MPQFIKGLDLSQAFYTEAVRPILETYFPQLTYTAGLIGSGSEVLGFDTEMSTDHHWGPRCLLFLSAEDKALFDDNISDVLSDELPYTFRGYSTHFGEPHVGDGNNGTQLLQEISTGKVNHRVEIYTIDEFMRGILGISSDHVMTPSDWLAIPQQKLLTLTAGRIFDDGLNLQKIRDDFAYYPHDVWLYLLLCGWGRIGQDEHLAPRAGFVGDELGSAVIAGRLVRSIMQLCFLMERRYAPYPKWFGTGFAQLDCAEKLTPILRDVQMGATFRERESALVNAYEILNTMFNALDITPPIEPAVVDFHGRGFQVTHGWRYTEKLREAITDPAVKAIADRTEIGSIDQFSDNTDMRENSRLHDGIARLYE